MTKLEKFSDNKKIIENKNLNTPLTKKELENLLEELSKENKKIDFPKGHLDENKEY